MDESAAERMSYRHYSRRLTPRVELLGLLHGYIVSMNLSLVVRDVSTGGFAVESPIGFPRAAMHEFRLTTANGDLEHVRARVVYCRETADDPNFPFVVGFSFVREATANRTVERLMDAATAVLEFP